MLTEKEDKKRGVRSVALNIDTHDTQSNKAIHYTVTCAAGGRIRKPCVRVLA